jgi:hypothetical protein
MLLKNDEKLAEHIRAAREEEFRQRTCDWITEQLKSSVVVDDKDQSPTNVERQMGRALPVERVEVIFKKLNPNLLFTPHVDDDGVLKNPSKKVMWFVHPDGTRDKIMIYENGLIPEHSIMNSVIQETILPEVSSPDKKFVLDRKDLTKHEVVPFKLDENGAVRQEGNIIWDDTTPLVGMQRVETVWSERVRGYRTMAAILVLAGHITAHQAETAFGNDNRLEWARAMGRSNEPLPW